MNAKDIRILSQKRYASPIKSSFVTNVPLSILDSTVATFAPTSAAWYYDPASGEQGKRALSIDHLVKSLEKILVAYPQWAGQLQFTNYDPHGDHTQRYGRLKLTYGSKDDPGVEIVTAHCSRIMSEVIPNAADRAANSEGWKASHVPSDELLPKTSLALGDLKEFIGLPCLIIQITEFDCGGVAIAVQFAHPVADAQAMVCFMHDWAKVSQSLLDNQLLPVLKPFFEPAVLDKAAAGDIDTRQANSTLRKAARNLPVHRFDYWASYDNPPDFFKSLTEIPPILDGTDLEPPGKPVPWNEWDVSAQVDYYLIYFSAEELENMWKEALSQSGSRISHLDALLAHMWILINRAKELDQDEQPVYFDITLGVRSRLSPPLPESFLGSPIIITNTTMKGREASDPNAIGKVASTIRSFLAQFNADTLPALLHEVAYQESGQRYWHAFLGERNTVVTSWLQLDVYGIDFGAKVPARYVEAIMPECDGCLHIMDAGWNQNPDKLKSTLWHETGVNVSLHLNSKDMQKLLKDPLLSRFRRS